jgi:hypothetical protein
MMSRELFDSSWGSSANPSNEYMLEQVRDGLRTVEIFAAADRLSVYEQYKLTHYVVPPTGIIKIPQLKLMHKQ